ncbi:hypothetical protein GCM10010156_49310 [Planobispora rosea]|uniref:ParB/Sulfiredoxin domain-containing protein n=1 Tax=Planobispora rosea TaxID=35762 RepID=A0A8J3S5S6_PLARO|nr:ParB/RepB/Spo0J family partition protein [Planobispora rosea]GGS84824.1 hypothetical protein GCM10010156_49310 [Planobispora rosea]GIH86442.1 hypothetical protein Pro02_48500 [Planobispora rosea]
MSSPSPAALSDDAPAPEATAADPLDGPDYPPHARIPVKRLEKNPRNTRTDYGITEEFIQTIADGDGPENDLVVFPSPDNPGMFRVHDGHRRLFALQQLANREENGGDRTVWCRIRPELVNNLKGMLLGQLTTSLHHKPLTDPEVGQTLFSLDEMGVDIATLQKATGKSRKDVETAIAAGHLSEDSRAVLAAANRQTTYEEEALLAAQEQDPDVPDDAVEEMRQLIAKGAGINYAINVVTTTRREAAEMARLIDELQTAGVSVTEEMPEEAVSLWRLQDADGATFTEQTHTTCPGHGAYFPSRTRPSFYCTCPQTHGYEPPQARQREEKPKLPTAQVRAGNTAWRESGKERLTWWKGKLATQSDPNQKVLKIIVELLAVDPPEPLRDLFGTIHLKEFFTDLVGKVPSRSTVSKAATGRLTWMLMKRIVAAMEYWMTQPSYSDHLWRTDALGRPESRAVAQRWLQICEKLGHTLQPIEQAVAQGRDYHGDLASSDATGELVTTIDPAAPEAETAHTTDAQPSGAGQTSPGGEIETTSADDNSGARADSEADAPAHATDEPSPDHLDAADAGDYDPDAWVDPTDATTKPIAADQPDAGDDLSAHDLVAVAG